MIVRKKLFTLLVANTGIDQNQTILIFDQQAAHGPCTHIVVVGRIGFGPERFWNNAKHRPTIQFKKASIYYMEFH